MAENRYNVDDILRELNSNKQRGEQERHSAPPSSAPRRPAPEALRPQREWEEQSAPEIPRREREAQFTPEPPRRERQSAPESARPRREREQPPEARRPMREPPAEAVQNPRLGQNLPPPRNREEMGKLLGRFDDSKQDPLDNLDFLSREPEYEEAGSQVKDYEPDWDKRDYQPRREPSRETPRQPRSDDRGYRETPGRETPGQQPPSRQAQPRQQPRPAHGDDYDDQGDGYRGASRQAPSRELPYREAMTREPRDGAARPPRREIPRMYEEDRRSMANAARLITSGGFDDDGGQEGRGQAPQSPAQPLQKGPPAPRRTSTPPPSRRESYDEEDIFGDPAPASTARKPLARPETRVPAREPRTPTRESRSGPRDEGRQELPPDLCPEPHGDDAAEESGESREGKDGRETGKREGRQQVAAQLGRMHTSLILRIIANLFALIGVAYLMLAVQYELPLPEFLSGEENMGAFLWSAVAMVIVSTLVSGNTVGGGILALFRLRPSNDSYSALAVFACLIQGAYMAMRPELMAAYGDNLYLPIAALMLLFNSLGKLIMLSRMSGSFAFISGKGEKHVAEIMDNREFARRISGDIVGEEPHIAYFSDALTVEGFMEQAFSESKSEDISKIIAPMTALAALVMALVSYLFSRDIFVSACVYTAALCITAPLAGVIASHLPLSITNGKLARFGASLCGYDAVNRFSDTNGVLLRCSQLFPRGSVSIQDIKTLDRRPIDQVITDAASVLCACDSNLSGIFRDMVPDLSLLHQPENLEYFDDMGLSAWVNGRRVLIGNRSLMMSYGVAIPGVEFERPYTTGNNEVLYLANSGEAAAMYVLAYKADKQMRRALELLCDRDMAVCVYSTDPNLTAEKISSVYSFPRELLSIIPASMQAGSEKYLTLRGKVKASVVHNGTPASYLRTILAARSCSKCVTLETALLLMSVVIGFAIVTFFAFTRQMETLTWITLAVYQFFWLLIELVVPLVKH